MWLNGAKIADDHLTLGEVMAGALNIPKADWTRHQKAAGAALRALGWDYGRVRLKDGTQPRMWSRPKAKD